MLRCLVATVIVVGLAIPANAQKIDDSYIDFAVPDTPALGLFGLSPNKVARPGNLKELSIAVLPLATAEAGIGSAVAISWAPVYTFANSIENYKHGFARHLALSLATTKDSKTTAINVGVGARFILVDHSDPVLDDTFNKDVLAILEKSLNGVQQRDAFWNMQVSPVLNDVVAKMTMNVVKQAELKVGLLDLWNIMTVPPGTTADSQFLRFQRAINRETNPADGINAVDLSADPMLKQKVEDLAKAYLSAETPPPATSKAKLAKTRKDFLDEHWHDPVVSVDVGILSASPSGTWGDLQARQLGSALLGTLPAGDSGQLVLQFQGRKGLNDNPDEDWFYSAGGRLLLGSATKRFSIEGLFSKAHAADPAKDGDTKRVTIGTEFRVAQGFWLELALGNEWSPAPSQGTNLFSLASLKYAFRTKPRFTQVPGVTDDEQ